MLESPAVPPLKAWDRYVFGVMQVVLLIAVGQFFIFNVAAYLGGEGLRTGDYPFFWNAAYITDGESLEKAYNGQIFQLEPAVSHWDEVIAGWGEDSKERLSSWAYPPHFLLYLRPLSLLPYELGYLAWMIFGLAALAWAVRSTFAPSWHGVAFTLLAPAALSCVMLGQTGLLAAALLIGGVGLLPRRPLLAGVLIGLLTFKPTLGLLLPFALVAGRHWQSFAAASITFLLLAVASVLHYGLQGWIDFFTVIPGYQMDFHRAADGLIVQLAPTIFMATKLLGLGKSLGLALQAGVTLAVVATIIWAFRTQADFTLKACLLFVGTALVSPYSHTYDGAMVSLAVLLLLREMATRDWRLLDHLAAVLAWGLPVILLYANRPEGFPLGPPITLFLFLVLLRRLVTSSAAARL